MRAFQTRSFVQDNPSLHLWTLDGWKLCSAKIQLWDITIQRVFENEPDFCFGYSLAILSVI